MHPEDSSIEERGERDRLKRPARPGPDDRPLTAPERTKEVDRDKDGLPDDPAEHRVPS